MDGRIRQAGRLYERAVFTGDAGPLAEAGWELDAAEADLAVARGRLMHARFLLRREQAPAAAEEDPGELRIVSSAHSPARLTSPPGRPETAGADARDQPAS